jgi:hypothetical protein
MVSSRMLRRVALVRTDVSKELSASFIKVTTFGEIGTTPDVTSNRGTPRRNTKHASVASYIWCCSWFTDSCNPDEGGATFLQNVGSYKSHTA